jgi:hypothetical protein
MMRSLFMKGIQISSHRRVMEECQSLADIGAAGLCCPIKNVEGQCALKTRAV